MLPKVYLGGRNVGSSNSQRNPKAVRLMVDQPIVARWLSEGTTDCEI